MKKFSEGQKSYTHSYWLELEKGAGRMPKFIWSCHDCGTVMPLWKVKCPNCKGMALSWLHLIVGVAVTLPALLLILKFL